MSLRGASVSVDLRNHLDAAASQQLFATSQHVKTFLSAMASWVKAYGKWFPVWKPAPSATEERKLKIVNMLCCLTSVLVVVRGDGTGSAGQQEMGACLWKKGYSSMELMLFWWLSRAVLAVAREMPAALEYKCSSSSSSSRERNNSGSIGSSCDLSGFSAAVDGTTTMASASSSRGTSDCTAYDTPGMGASSSSGSTIRTSTCSGGDGSGLSTGSTPCQGWEHNGRDGTPLDALGGSS